VSKEKILPSMKPMVFAEHDPKIKAVFPHTNSLRAVTRGVGRDLGARDYIKSSRPNSRKSRKDGKEEVLRKGSLSFVKDMAVLECYIMKQSYFSYFPQQLSSAKGRLRTPLFFVFGGF